eukprot:2885276-Pyramimonas_sp.AAC.1
MEKHGAVTLVYWVDVARRSGIRVEPRAGRCVWPTRAIMSRTYEDFGTDETRVLHPATDILLSRQSGHARSDVPEEVQHFMGMMTNLCDARARAAAGVDITDTLNSCLLCEEVEKDNDLLLFGDYDEEDAERMAAELGATHMRPICRTAWRA